MRRRLQAWLEETHGTGFELVRHFLFGLFDSEAAAAPGEWMKAAFGALAVLFSAGILGFTLYWERYDLLWRHGTPALFREAMRADELSLIAVAMGVTALLTILQWQSLFPNRRDCLAFGGWPVSGREIFTAKFGSLLLIFTRVRTGDHLASGRSLLGGDGLALAAEPIRGGECGGKFRGGGGRLRLRRSSACWRCRESC